MPRCRIESALFAPLAQTSVVGGISQNEMMAKSSSEVRRSDIDAQVTDEKHLAVNAAHVVWTVVHRSGWILSSVANEWSPFSSSVTSRTIPTIFDPDARRKTERCCSSHERPTRNGRLHFLSLHLYSTLARYLTAHLEPGAR